MTTSIEWVTNPDGSKGETWNPTTGCTKVSEGCDNCYAERIANRFGGPGYFDTVRLHPDRLDKPLYWRKPRRVFVDSMSDLFHDDVPGELIARVFAVMALSGEHTFQVLTKRPGRMASVLSSEAVVSAVRKRVDQYLPGAELTAWPLLNVWLGVSVENQKWADVRIPKLLETPAAVRFLSCEPLLGPVDFRAWLPWKTRAYEGNLSIDWCIVGGESGPHARPMHPTWVRSLRDQCQAAGVPFFFKQWGEYRPAEGALLSDFAKHPVALDVQGRVLPGETDVRDVSAFMVRIGKKAAGRDLDGRKWNEYPKEAG